MILIMKFPRRYIGTIPRKFREKQLIDRIKSGSFKPDGFKARRRSKWTIKFHEVYPGLKFNKPEISRVTGIPLNTLNTVYNRGRRAWQTSGSRPGTTANQWGTARVYKFVLVTLKKVPKTWLTKVDPDNNLRLYKTKRNV